MVNLLRKVAPQRQDEERLLTRRERDVLNGLAGGNTYQTLAKSLGLGLRARTPVGLLRLDLAFPLDRRPEDEEYKLYFGFGNAF